MLNAMRDMVVEHFLLYASQRGAHGCDLRHDIDAITVFGDHAGKAADLSLDATKAFEAGRFRVLLHP